MGEAEEEGAPKFTVRIADADEGKSIQEREAELIAKHEEEVSGAEKEEDIVVNIKNDVDDSEDIDESVVKRFFKNKFDREVDDFSSLFEEKVIEKDVELPEDVEAFYRFKKETGRGLSDFYRLNQDIDTEDEESMLKNYLLETKSHLDKDDIDFEYERRFAYDEDMDDEDDIRSKKIARKEELVKAREFFNQAKEKYRAPLESNEGFVPEDEKEAYESFKSYKQQEESLNEENRKKGEYFSAKTNELFSDKFEGFGFKINDKNLVYKPEDASSLKERQSNMQNFFGRFLDENGYLKDAEMFHKALAVASDPDSFAKFFYEKGQSDATTDISIESRNLDMVRKAPEAPAKNGGFTVRQVEDRHNPTTIKIKTLKN